MDADSDSIWGTYLLIGPGKTDCLQMFEIVVSQVIQKVLLHSIRIISKYHSKVFSRAGDGGVQQ